MSSAPPPQRARRVWPWAQWLFVPLAVLSLAEAFAGLSVDRVPTWYGAAERLAALERVQVIFVGSSRTQVAIDTEVFERELAARGARRGRVLNLGRGYSTDAEHLLGLRRLLAAQPHNLQGLTLFVEAPGGYPFVTHLKREAWAHAEQPWMLVDLLRPSDLRGFFQYSGLRLGTRLHVALRVLLSPWALFNRRERLREHWFEQVLPAVVRGDLPDLTANGELGQDLRGPGRGGSIRVDEAAVATARAAAERVARRLTEDRAPAGSYAGSILDIVRLLVKQVGGRMAFYEPPQGAVFLEAYRTPQRQEDRRSFAEQSRAWGSCVVTPDFVYTDEDVPDYWHLQRGRAAEFTRAVAEAWLANCDPLEPGGA